MTLLDDIKAWYEEENYPPELEDAEQIEYVITGGQRWGNNVRMVYKRDNEYVAIEDVEPATEMQNWGDYGKPTIFEVDRVEVPTVKIMWVRKELV